MDEQEARDFYAALPEELKDQARATIRRRAAERKPGVDLTPEEIDGLALAGLWKYMESLRVRLSEITEEEWSRMFREELDRLDAGDGMVPIEAAHNAIRDRLIREYGYLLPELKKREPGS
jgi:hypothetical protein